ncbi:MAG: hypothetical protein JSR55_14430 [Proteobacteria bacterium]|nr:hypothetical protein [Pseudomonadota bacterium]
MTPDSKTETPATGKQRLFQFLFFLIAMAPVAFGSLFALTKLHWLSCPSGTFLAGTSHADLQKAAWVVSVVALFFLGEYWLSFYVPSFGKIIGQKARKYRHASPFLRRLQSNICILILCVSLPVMFIAALSNFCLTSDTVNARAWPWLEFRSYGWHQLGEIQTACWRGARGSWPSAYLLEMRDGATIDIANGLGRNAPLYPELHRALQDVPFEFDARRVAHDCRNSNVEFLKTRP